MQPAWIAFPGNPWGSSAWRMGAGEEYWEAWTAWFRSLPDAERTAYKSQWAEPDGWRDCYAFIETGELPQWLLERQRMVANAAIPPTSDEDLIEEPYRVLWLIRNHLSRVSIDRAIPQEILAEIYRGPDGGLWRLSSDATRGGLRLLRLQRAAAAPMPTPTAFASFDRQLSEADADSMDWNDGLGHHTASELLANFGAADWAALVDEHARRDTNWRECLATVLHPKFGVSAVKLLLALASDAELDVAFRALRSIAGSCGVNSGAQGPYFDPHVQVPVFFVLARNTPSLLSAIERVSAQSAEQFRAEFRLLVDLLQA